MKEKKNYITYLNVIAAMAVLIQHSSGYAQRVFREGIAWRGGKSAYDAVPFCSSNILYDNGSHTYGFQ